MGSGGMAVSYDLKTFTHGCVTRNTYGLGCLGLVADMSQLRPKIFRITQLHLGHRRNATQPQPP